MHLLFSLANPAVVSRQSSLWSRKYCCSSEVLLIPRRVFE
jgi:hypothetical protein